MTEPEMTGETTPPSPALHGFPSGGLSVLAARTSGHSYLNGWTALTPEPERVQRLAQAGALRSEVEQQKERVRTLTRRADGRFIRRPK